LESQKTLNSQNNPEQKRAMMEGIRISNLKLYYKAIITKQHGIVTKTDTQINGIE
jgi:hypothetical protein